MRQLIGEQPKDNTMVTEEHMADIDYCIKSLSQEIYILADISFDAVQEGMSDKKGFQALKEENLKIIAGLKTKVGKIDSTLANLQEKIQRLRIVTAQEEDSYAEGYETGVTWRRDYRPGGPFEWHYTDSGFHSKEERAGLREKAQLSQLCRKEWLRGFDKGLSDQGRVL